MPKQSLVYFNDILGVSGHANSIKSDVIIRAVHTFYSIYQPVAWLNTDTQLDRANPEGELDLSDLQVFYGYNTDIFSRWLIKKSDEEAADIRKLRLQKHTQIRCRFGRSERREDSGTWKWEEFFDHTICMSLFEEYRDAVATLDESNIGFDELAKKFLLGCKYRSGTGRADTNAADNQKI